MRRFLRTAIIAGFLLLGLPHQNGSAAGLPTFADFSRVDRTRRLMGQLQTSELMEVSRIDSGLILGTVKKNSNDVSTVWGAAELLVTWSDKRALFESALAATSNQVEIATRFACAAARQGEYDLALKWARYGEESDPDNTIPWLTELWVLKRLKKPQVLSTKPAAVASSFHDYTVEAIEARVHLLEQMGYSAYSARRLGFKPDSDALLIAKDMAQPPIEDATKALLKETADYLQHRRQFLLSEMIGQTIERTLYALRPDADSSVTVRVRSEEIEQRRDELKLLLNDVERNTIDYATEKQMVGYFDDVLGLGEEDAMKKLVTEVPRPASATPSPDSPPNP